MNSERNETGIGVTGYLYVHIEGSRRGLFYQTMMTFEQNKTIVELYFVDKGHLVFFIPKFHCELNPIERVCGQTKRYTPSYTNFTLPG